MPFSWRMPRERLGLGVSTQQMIVVSHQTIGVADPAVAENHSGEGIHKQLPVRIAKEDLLACVASGGQMVNRAGELQAKRSCHEPLLSVGLS